MLRESAMEIKPNQTSPEDLKQLRNAALQTGRTASGSASAAAQNTSVKQAGQDTTQSSSAVVLSGLSSTLRSAGAGSASDIDAGKVSRISNALQDGTLSISSATIANGLLSHIASTLQLH
jgi:flagellar biosynthesis anti-sigma factor FlgM